MTTEATTTEATKTVTPPATQAPTVDIEKIVNSKVDEIVASKLADIEGKAASQVTDKIVKSLTGEKKDENPIHAAFIENPDELLGLVERRATDKALRTVRAEMDATTEIKASLDPIYADYPMLRNVPNEIMAEFAQTDKNKSVNNRLAEAAEKIAKKLNIEKKSDEQKRLEATQSAPHGATGSMGTTPQSNIKRLVDSAKSFTAARKAQFTNSTTAKPSSASK